MAKSIGARDKWEAYARRVNTNTSSKAATFELTVGHTLDLLGNRKSGQLLDIGCGFGEIDILLAKNSDFFITGCDISDTCVQKAKDLIWRSGMGGHVKIEHGDVYNFVYPENYFDIVTSFGYASAASYKGVQSEVWRVLKPGGFLICDFINALSLYKLPLIMLNWRRMLKENKKNYNFATTKGIKQYFERFGLEFVRQKFFNSYPPFNFLPKESLLIFEKIADKFFNRLLGRVRLVCFRKTEKK